MEAKQLSQCCAQEIATLALGVLLFSVSRKPKVFGWCELAFVAFVALDEIGDPEIA